jgi:hypothetical protein
MDRMKKNHGSISDRNEEFFSSLKRPERIWNLPSALFIKYRRLFAGSKADGA